MEKERGSRFAAYERKLDYLRLAHQEGADEIVPPWFKPESWTKIKDIGKADAYLPYSQKELGKIWGITHQEISAASQKFLARVWNNSSLPLRQKFPLSEIFVRKPLSQERREKQSKSRGGVTSAIREQLEQGITNEEQILESTGLSKKQIVQARHKLRNRNWEGKMPEEFFKRKTILWQDLEKDFERESDDKKVQEMLNNTPMTAIRGYILRHKTDQSPVFLDFLTSILRNKGFYVRPWDVGLIFAEITNAGIPIKKEDTGHKIKVDGREYPQIFYVAAAKHTDRIIEALKLNPQLYARLTDNPIKLAYGPRPDHYPNTTRLVKKREYATIGSIVFKYFGVVVNGSKYPDLLSGSPVSIFSTSKGIFCSLGDLKKFLPFLERRLGELERIK